MLNPKKSFKGQKNKENNLSFRNIAATTQNQNQNQNQNQSLIKINAVDKGFKFSNDQSNSFYNSGQDLQQQLNYVGSCFNHSNKLAEYVQTISQQQYCKLCAAKLASLGYKLDRSQNSVSRDISPSLLQLRQKQSYLQIPQPEYRDSKLKPNYSTNSSKAPAPVKFSTLISQKNRLSENLEAKFDQNQKIVQQYMEIYSQKMDLLQQLLNDLRIKDTQFINKIKSQNQSIYQQAKRKQQYQEERGIYDLFGKSLMKDSAHEAIRFKLPTQQKIQKLQKIHESIISIIQTNEKSISPNNIPLIKSINSNESNKTKQIIIKNSSSISNLSSKSIFKKQKMLNENFEKFNSQINLAKVYQNQNQIQNSRFSTNSAILRKKNIHSNNPMKTESISIKRRNTQNSLQDSNSCQDTPQSIKSKISSNSFVLPKNAAIAMFEKINVCQSIDIQPEETSIQDNKMVLKQETNQNSWFNNERNANKSRSKQFLESKSSYTNISQNKSISVGSKGRKSFNRYHNFEAEQ